MKKKGEEKIKREGGKKNLPRLRIELRVFAFFKPRVVYKCDALPLRQLILLETSTIGEVRTYRGEI
jgi:hypothetical protein